MGLRSIRILVATVMVAALLAACSEDSSTPKAIGCPPAKPLDLRCGALWGITTQEPTQEALDALEGAVGRQFDLVYRFHDINDTVPDEQDLAAVESGHLLHISIESQDFSGDQPTGQTWADVAAGKYDNQLRQQAKGIALINDPVFMTFDHEVDQPARMALGEPAEFIAAWRHLHDIYEQEGATNAIWVWVILGWAPSLHVAATLWPGNDYVDWISWDIYNQSGCRGAGIEPGLASSFEQDVRLVSTWIHDVGPRIGMDPTKPWMISEAGSVFYPDDAAKTADWYTAIPDVLRANPQIAAVTLWDHDGHLGCDYRFDQDPSITEAVAEAGDDSWVNKYEHNP